MKNLVVVHAFSRIKISPAELDTPVVSSIIQGLQRFHHEQRAKKNAAYRKQHKGNK